MPRDYTARLSNLRRRRLGPTRSAIIEELARQRTIETYERRAQAPATKYTLGSMQEVDPDYTRISFEEGDRVKEQLRSGLNAKNISATYEYQGSVPLNVHIRGYSDIDLLVLHGSVLTYDSSGARASSYTPAARTPLDYVMELRRESEGILQQRFYGANVDISGSKSISLTGGSLKRKVDIVPSHWHDTAAYQYSHEKHDREVRILDKHVPTLLANRPFMHMKRINEKDVLTGGSAKKVVRLLKNIRKDTEQQPPDCPAMKLLL